MVAECEACNKTFSRVEHLRRHLATHDKAHKEFGCPQCGKGYTRRDTLHRHMLSHGPRTRAASVHRNTAKRPPRGPTFTPPSSFTLPPEACAAAAALPTTTSTTTPLPSNVTDAPINWLPCDFIPNLDSGRTHDASSEPQHVGADSQDPTPASLRHGHDDDERIMLMASLLASMAETPSSVQRSGQAINIAPSSKHFNLPDGIDARYTGGLGARSSQAERVTRHRSSIFTHARHAALSAQSATEAQQDAAWLHTFHEYTPNEHQPHIDGAFHMPLGVYSDILSKSDARFPVRPVATVHFLHSGNMPSKVLLDRFIHLYFDHFHPVYPFLDQPLLSMPNWGWSLCLATAAIGCRYSHLQEAAACGDAITLLLRETLMKELDFDRADITLPYLQALLLNIVDLSSSSHPDLMSMGYDCVGSVINACVSFGLMDELANPLTTSHDMDQSWMAWRCRETRRRTGVFAWILGCTLAFTRDTSPFLSLHSLSLSMPSSEELWTASCAEEWCQTAKISIQDTSLHAAFLIEERSRYSIRVAMSKLYKDQALVEGISQLAGSVLIYALVQRTWDLKKYFDDPLSVHGASSGAFSDHGSETKAFCYPAAIPAFSHWRNGACDYLDVLHWDALANSAKVKGLEGPIFLKLHLARLLLLAPIREMLVLADHLAKVVRLPHHLTPRRMSVSTCQHIVASWVRNDRFKARLAIIHAGATFWHVRRYASDSFVQPFAIFAATLTLWHFGLTAAADAARSLPSHETEPAANLDYDGQVHESTESVSLPTTSPLHPSPASTSASDHYSVHLSTQTLPRSLNIDRPIDDEFVQYFVRNGQAEINLCAERIANVCSPAGAHQILLEGAAILRTAPYPIWHVSESYAAMLQVVAAATQDPDT